MSTDKIQNITGIIDNRTPILWLNILTTRCDAASMQRTARGTQRTTRHPTEGEKLAACTTDTSLVVTTANAHWGQEANHIFESFGEEAGRC